MDPSRIPTTSSWKEKIWKTDAYMAWKWWSASACVVCLRCHSQDDSEWRQSSGYWWVSWGASPAKGQIEPCRLVFLKFYWNSRKTPSVSSGMKSVSLYSISLILADVFCGYKPCCLNLWILSMQYVKIRGCLNQKLALSYRYWQQKKYVKCHGTMFFMKSITIYI